MMQMQKFMTKFMVIILSTVFLSGCWDAAEIQDILYITALGIDYQDHQYTVYVQLLDFSTVAKAEGGAATEKPIYVGSGTGPTIQLAVNNLYKMAQQEIYWGHVTAIVLSESCIKKGYDEVFEILNRYREVRYTKMIYGTKLAPRDILSITSFFNLSPLSSVLHNPMEAYKQRSAIVPIRVFNLLADLREPGTTALLPSLNINDIGWFKNKKKNPALEVDGVYALHGKVYKGWLSESQLCGLRWINAETVHSNLSIYTNQKLSVALAMETPKTEITPIVENSKVRFQVNVKVKGNIIELMENISEEEIINKVKKQIKEELLTTYKKGLAIKADLFQLEETLYRHKNKAWKEATNEGTRFSLTMDSLDSITIDVQIIHSGKYKFIAQ